MTPGGHDDGSPFRDRFAIEPIGDDGVLIDLLTGSFFHVNRTATLACLALRESASRADAVAHLASSMALATDAAAALLDQVRSQLAEPGVRTDATGPFRYCRHEHGYALEQNDRVVLTTDRSGRELRLVARPDTLTFKMLDYLRAMTPKLLHLRGATVLHAAACELPEGLTAFSGPSGAGKTTTARAFTGAGAQLISEDLLVLAADSTATVVAGGEKRAHDWAATAADALTADPERGLDCGALDDVALAGPEVPLAAIWFVDSARRNGDDFRQRTLTAIDGALALLGNTSWDPTAPRTGAATSARRTRSPLGSPSAR